MFDWITERFRQEEQRKLEEWREQMRQAQRDFRESQRVEHDIFITRMASLLDEKIDKLREPPTVSSLGMLAPSPGLSGMGAMSMTADGTWKMARYSGPMTRDEEIANVIGNDFWNE